MHSSFVVLVFTVLVSVSFSCDRHISSVSFSIPTSLFIVFVIVPIRQLVSFLLVSCRIGHHCLVRTHPQQSVLVFSFSHSVFFYPYLLWCSSIFHMANVLRNTVLPADIAASIMLAATTPHPLARLVKSDEFVYRCASRMPHLHSYRVFSVES